MSIRFKHRFQTYWYNKNDDMIKRFSRKHNMPNVICFLDNHNMLVGMNSCEEIQSTVTNSGIKCMRICNKHYVLHTDGVMFKK